MHLDIRIQRKHPRAKVPSYGTQQAACLDLYPVLADQDAEDGTVPMMVIAPGEVKAIRLGWAMQVINPQWCLELHSRSGQGKVRVRLANSTGIIDADFTGELKALVENSGSAPFEVRESVAICQMKPALVPRMVLHEVTELEATARGEGGFGSTDKR